MKLSNLSIKRPVTTTMIVLLVVLLGIISFNRTNIDLLPDIVYPGAAVITSYNGAGPEEVETMVTKPLEGSLATVTNIQTLSSTSSKDQSTVMAEFDWGTDMDTASMDMRESIDLIRDALPDDASDPYVVKFDPSMMPIMQLGVTADLDLAELKELIENQISPKLERLDGVATVNLVGGKEREILVEVDENKLNNYNISFENIRNTLMANNLNMSGGSVRRGSLEYLVRVTGKFDSVSEIRNLKIASNVGGLVELEEVAKVTDTFKEMSTKSRLNGSPIIGLTIQKATDANTVAVSNRVQDELDEIIKSNNNNLQVISIMDQADYIEQSIGSVGRNAIFGALLAVIILWIFLHNWRSTLIIATAIPISVITTFTLIYFGNLTINLMTLGGLALGIGMLVDNSIVVLENIYRYRKEGKTKLEAAKKGSNEVGMAIAASTLTTAVVFLPVVFVGGMASQIFQELALTVSFALLASLLVSLTIIPVMSSKILKVNKDGKDENKWLEVIKDKYSNSLNWTINRRWLVLALVVILFIGSVALYPLIGAEFIPSMDQGQFTIDASLPIGTNIEKTENTAARIEEMVLEIPEVDSLLTNIGTSGQSKIASIAVNLVDLSERDRSTFEVMEELRNKINLAGVEIDISAMDMMGGGITGGKAVEVRILGDDLTRLEDIAQSVKSEMENVSGIREIEDSISEGRPEMQISIDRSLATNYGLTVAQIGSFLDTAISGSNATRYEVGGEEYDVTVKLDDKAVETPEDVKNMTISSPSGAKVKLDSIADFAIEKGPQSITRENQQRYVTVNAALFERDLGDAMEDIQNRLDSNLTLSEGYSLEYGGEYQEMVSAFSDLGFALILAVVLVYMVMASQFESLVDPFIIMFTVPMAVIGVLGGLFITGHTISVVSIIGMVMLAGIVVNNAIVLVDYTNTLRDRGKSLKEAVIEAGRVRLRPILMTALTTILALLPIAIGFGEGSEMQAPMGVVVVSGLLVATFLTLYIVPVLYTIFEHFAKKSK